MKLKRAKPSVLMLIQRIRIAIKQVKSLELRRPFNINSEGSLR